MRFWSLLGAAAIVCGTALVAQQPPSFRTEVDSVQRDVRVVDERFFSHRETQSTDLSRGNRHLPDRRRDSAVDHPAG
jgi:hypothetical protein